MGQEAVEGFLWGAVAAAGVTAQQLFGRGEERPSPAVFAVVLIDGIDKIFGGVAAYAAVEQRQEAHLLYGLHQFWARVYLGGDHRSFHLIGLIGCA